MTDIYLYGGESPSTTIKLRDPTTFTPPGGSTFGKVNIGGVWKTISAAYVNISGTWKSVSAISVNVSGTWKQIT